MTIPIIKIQESKNRIAFFLFLVISGFLVFLSIKGFLTQRITIGSVMISFAVFIIYLNISVNYSKVGTIQMDDSLIRINYNNIEQTYSWDEIEIVRLKYGGYRGEPNSGLFFYYGRNVIEISIKSGRNFEFPVLIESFKRHKIVSMEFKNLNLKHGGKVVILRES